MQVRARILQEGNVARGKHSSWNTAQHTNTYDDFEIRSFPFSGFQMDEDHLQTCELY